MRRAAAGRRPARGGDRGARAAVPPTSTVIMLSVAKQTIQVPLEEHEAELLRVTAAAAGRSVPEFARDTLLGAVYADGEHRRAELRRVARVSAALNKRLAQ